jgi:hypothetical protein
MALTNSAVLVPAIGHIFVAPVGTAEPTPAAIDAFLASSGTMAGWESVGHTARDELPTLGFDGGDTETKGTWQNANFREVVTEVPADYVTFNAHQFDRQILSLYYGQTGGTTPGRFAVANAPTTTIERALLIIIVDGTTNIALYANKVSLRREDSIELSVDEFAYMPLRATFLKNGSADLYVWISSDTIIGS